MGSWVKGGTYFKTENSNQPIFLFLTGLKFALIHVYIIRMCNKIKSKASILQQYLLCLVVQQTVATPQKSNRKAMNRNWSNQKANPALKTKKGNT